MKAVSDILEERSKIDEIEDCVRAAYGSSFDDWRPTEEDYEQYRRDKGWVSFDDFRFDHMTPEEREIMERAIGAAREFSDGIQEHPGRALILIATSAGDDTRRTGYGCGKTMLAQATFYSQAMFNFAPGAGRSSLNGYVPGRFYEAREAMALFDHEDYSPQSAFKNFRQIVVIDDVGREGTLRWEKRDLSMQLEEKQHRYYSIIDHCYKNGISIVLTSNLASRELATMLGGAAWSRLLQMCPKRFRINMTGLPDMRPELAEDW